MEHVHHWAAPAVRFLTLADAAEIMSSRRGDQGWDLLLRVLDMSSTGPVVTETGVLA
ncbi:hypothetical protein SAMN04515671_3629 [Nakamurella panacisegetis]|uniref:Uncharacterized protein n=1 Tax=Nakamurella panacisegetis TaxID=1090615 RepID=A0A1H0RKV6_9ACTN|nr:hypothetical protein [Nakamurella panacisegetis]SDP30040.1 hypothetical protein SAMN04515671_3629 [Nakamurella panacisegetis]